MSDITKSLKEIFEERISSPFYGTLIYAPALLDNYVNLGLIRRIEDTIMLTEKGAKFYNELQLWKANNHLKS